MDNKTYTNYVNNYDQWQLRYYQMPVYDAGYCVTGNSTNNNKKTIMQKVSNMMKKILDKDTQALVKAGFINGNLDLTCDGVAALNAIIFSEKKAELVALANEKIAEAEKEVK